MYQQSHARFFIKDLQADLLSGFEAYDETSGGRLCFPDAYYGMIGKM